MILTFYILGTDLTRNHSLVTVKWFDIHEVKSSSDQEKTSWTWVQSDSAGYRGRTLNSAKWFKSPFMKCSSHTLISNQCCFMCLFDWLGRTAGNVTAEPFSVTVCWKTIVGGTVSGAQRSQREQSFPCLQRDDVPWIRLGAWLQYNSSWHMEV